MSGLSSDIKVLVVAAGLVVFSYTHTRGVDKILFMWGVGGGYNYVDMTVRYYNKFLGGAIDLLISSEKKIGGEGYDPTPSPRLHSCIHTPGWVVRIKCGHYTYNIHQIYAATFLRI